jgi:DNA-binding response OmpR family regulator
MSAQTVLVVEDEPRIAAIAADYLRHAGYAVIVARDGLEALRHVGASHPDLVVLDLGLPGVDGLEVARTIRASSSLPIIMVTARVAEGDRLAGLDSGADDYMTKPFSPRELVARVRAVLRRSQPRGTDVSGRHLRLGDLAVDLERLTVTRNGEAIDLTGTEFRLLTTLARHPGRVFTRAQLLDAIGDADGESFDRAVDAHVKNLRRKIERDSRRPRYVLTIYGVGYKAADA